MKTSHFFHTLIIAAAIGVALPVHAQEKGKTTNKDKSAGKSEKAEKSKKAEKSITTEPLGQLATGQKPAEVLKLLGKPETKGKKQSQEATGTSVQDWNYPAQGLTVTMEFAGKQESVSMIRAGAACKLATARGIKIGSSEADVAKAYSKEKDKESSQAGESFVAGSLYDGIVFTFKKGKVSDILIGAAAE